MEADMSNNAMMTLAQTFWLPNQASNFAQESDRVFYFTLAISIFFFAVIVGLMLVFIVRYRRRHADQRATSAVTHNTWLEVTWTGIPLIIVIAIFWMGFKDYLNKDRAPSNTIDIQVTAFMWGYTFTYPDGAEASDLVVPINRPVRLLLTSKDVLHGLYIPAFRVHKNLVPNRQTMVWFEANKLGNFHLFCTQYCGNGHSQMQAKVIVVDAGEYSAKLAAMKNIFVDSATKRELGEAEVGQLLYRKYGCFQCHSVDGTPSQGPTWKGMYGKADHAFTDGTKMDTSNTEAEWDAYLAESILKPNAKIVKGFQGVMASFDGQLSGSEYKDRLRKSLIAYMKSDALRNPAYTVAPTTTTSAPATRPAVP